MQFDSRGYVICPKCGRPTRIKTVVGTEMKKFPLYCTWCRTETMVDFKRE